MPARHEMENVWENTILPYANDIVVMSITHFKIIVKTDDLIKATKPMGLKVNQDKTNYMVVSRGNRSIANLIVSTFQIVNDFKYLGRNIYISQTICTIQ